MIPVPVNPYCQFKTPEIEKRTPYLCNMAKEVLSSMADYCKDRALPLVITDSVSTAAEDKALSRVSDEHRTGRAFDVSIHGWLELAITDFTQYFETRYLWAAAIGKTTNRPRLIFRHDNGHGSHIHVQVGVIYGLANPLKDLVS